MFQRITLAVLMILIIAVMGTATCWPAQPVQAAQQAPDIASYTMDVTLNPAAKTVAGSAHISYHNRSEDTLHDIWMRLYLKAFSSANTIWMRESGGGIRGDTVDINHLGDITIQSLTLSDGTDLLASTTMTDTLLQVPLPHSLEPDQLLELDVRWTSQLPKVFARTGYGGRDDTFFMVGQWYPKMAVYDRGHWDTEPWHANSEFFNDFGNYDVTITAPANYIVAGAGVPTGENSNADGNKIHSFKSTNVTDFAFAASPDFQQASAKAGSVDVDLYYLPEHSNAVREYLDISVGALQAYSAWYGDYPHPRLSVIDVPDNASGAGGMEYPTLVTGGTFGLPSNSGIIGYVTAHEIGHQWWPMQTATNEGREPWLDEGLTEYSSTRYLLEAHHHIGFGSLSITAQTLDLVQYASSSAHPANLPAWDYNAASYDSIVYGKTAVGLLTLENVVGTDRFRQAMANYLAEYRYKHPTAADFRASIERSLDGNVDWFFNDYIAGDGVVDYSMGPIVNGADSRVTVLRQGSVRAPIDVLITLASGTQEQRHWDGQANTITYSFSNSDPIVRAEADPERKLAAEINVVDNGSSAQPEATAALTLGGRLLLLFQLFAQSVGLFG